MSINITEKDNVINKNIFDKIIQNLSKSKNIKRLLKARSLKQSIAKPNIRSIKLRLYKL